MSTVETEYSYILPVPFNEELPRAEWAVGMNEDTIERLRHLVEKMDSSLTFKRLWQSDRPLHLLVHFGGWVDNNVHVMHEFGKIKSIDINKKDNSGMTALLLASYYGFEEHVEELLKLGADPNIQNDKGNNAITYCCEWQRLIKNFQLKKNRILNLLRNPPPTYFALAQKNKLAMVMNKLGEEKNLKLGTLEDIHGILESIGFVNFRYTKM